MAVTANKRLILVSPPYATPTSPPLGVCALKGFVQHALPDWSVKVLDWNLATYRRTIEDLGRGCCPPGPNYLSRLV